MGTAATYLRSSKDRHDVSLAAQRRELHALARQRGLTIVAEYSDAVESAKSEDRPGFQELLRAMREPRRPWSTLLMTDTSRLFRSIYGAEAFRHEAQKLGVAIAFSKVPEVDPISTVILHAVLEAMGQVHSMMSREKGLSGMAENVRQGFRAGGRAPFGYRLVKVETGARREGQAVMKSRLEESDHAPRVRDYLRARAGGTPRPAARAEHLPELSISTLVCMEWNALTYAGHTVWNVHTPKASRGTAGNRKRRPRAEWHLRESTHPGLIKTSEAERLIGSLETSDVGRAVSAAKASVGDYVLFGLLLTPAGTPWTGHMNRGTRTYRVRKRGDAPGRYLDAERADRLLTEKVARDMRSDAFVRALVKGARKASSRQADPAADDRRRIATSMRGSRRRSISRCRRPSRRRGCARSRSSSGNGVTSRRGWRGPNPTIVWRRRCARSQRRR